MLRAFLISLDAAALQLLSENIIVAGKLLKLGHSKDEDMRQLKRTGNMRGTHPCTGF